MLNKTFTAKLEKSPNRGGWTYVVWPGSVKFFETRGLVKVSGKIDGHPSAALSWLWETDGTCCRSRQRSEKLSGRRWARSSKCPWKSGSDRSKPIPGTPACPHLIAEYSVEVDHQVCSRLVHDCIAIHVASRVSRRHRRQATLYLVREGLYPPIPPRRQLSGPIVFLRETWRQFARVVIVSNDAQVLFAEAFFAVAAMAILILMVSCPVFPSTVVIMVASLKGL
jgi:hypothetical protein